MCSDTHVSSSPVRTRALSPLSRAGCSLPWRDVSVAHLPPPPPRTLLFSAGGLASSARAHRSASPLPSFPPPFRFPLRLPPPCMNCTARVHPPHHPLPMTTRRLTRHLRHRTLSSSAFSSLLLVAVSVTFFLLETLRAGGYFFLPSDPDGNPRRLFLSLSAVSWPLLLTSAACLCLVSHTSTRARSVVVATDGVRRFYVSGPGLTGLLLFFLWAAAGAGLVTAADVFLILGSRSRWEAAGESSWPAMVAGGISAALAGWTALVAVWHGISAGRDFAAPTTAIQPPRDAEGGTAGVAGGGGAWTNDAYGGGGGGHDGWPPLAAQPLGHRPPPAPGGAYAAGSAPAPPPPGGYYDHGGGHRAFGAPGAAVVAPPAGWAAGSPPPPSSGPTGPVAGAPYVPPASSPAQPLPPAGYPPPAGHAAAAAAAAAALPAGADADTVHAAGVAAQARAHRLAGCVATCVGMGFDVSAARAAADATDGDVSAAVAQLLARQVGG